MKKLYKIVLALILTFTLVGCTSDNKSEKEDFTKFVEELPALLAGTNGFDLNYTFHNPSAYGIDKEVGDIEAATTKEYEESFTECKDLLKELEAFDYDSLTKEQQEDYDVLKDYLERQLLLEDYVYFDNNYLGSYIGMQAQLPIILLEFELHDKQDLETYLNVLKTAPEAFKGYADIERERQDEGVGMSQVLLDGVIEQCENFANGDVTFLVDEMNDKIDAAEFLSDAEKEEAKINNESYTKNEFVQAYTTLKEELQSITPDKADGGIADQENGQEYYEALFQNQCGFDWTIDELEDYLEEKESEYMSVVYKAMLKDPSIETTMFGQSYGTFNSAEENIDYLADKYTEYFPDAGMMKYRVVDIPESMQENFSPAAYLTSRIDRQDDEPLLILINGEYESSNFSTIAHEGYPGHMYQDCYFQQLDVSSFRYLLSCKGYAEGWATYIEGQAHWFTQEDNEDILEVYEDYQKLNHAMMAKWDININYHGMTREEFKAEIESMYGEGVLTDEELYDQYNILLENPTNYLMYFVNGLYMDELYNKAEEELGKDFDQVEFHEVILDIGSVSMTLLTEKVDAYIEENK
ncbi:MAG: DUF885 domain-containing protein [Coprobacillaceae bacterium]